MEIYKKPYCRAYLSLSIKIFQKQQSERAYLNHPNWFAFYELLKNANCYAIAVGVGLCIGVTSKSYFDIPMEKENFDIEKKELLEKYEIEEIIIVR